MFHVLACLGQHDLRLVALAVLLCGFASAVTFGLLGRARAHKENMGWILCAGLVAGSGIWATHFVAMLAYHGGVSIAYAWDLTILSILLAIVVCTLGFILSAHRHPIVGGVFVGFAISGMHYVGIAALRAPAYFEWNGGIVAASVLFGMVFSILAMQAKFAVAGHWRNRALAATLFAIAVASMHFVGMSSLTLIPNGQPQAVSAGLDPVSLGIAIAAVAAMIAGAGLSSALLDAKLMRQAHQEADRLRAHVKELEETKAKLELTSKNLRNALHDADAANRTKARFLASMSHELRTPLNAVIGFSEVMLGEYYGKLGDGRYKGYARDIHDAGVHLLSLINDVLDLSKLEAGAMTLFEEVIRVPALIDEALRMVERQAQQKRIALSMNVPADLPRLVADARRLRQVFINLLANAVKFTPEGGSVRLTASLQTEGLLIAVTDTGVGIADEDLPRVLERFAQADNAYSRQYEGTGLGLPIAKQFVELHGGKLSIESQPGVGTTVSVILPTSRVVAFQAVA